jgi:hypothetical protein
MPSLLVQHKNPLLLCEVGSLKHCSKTFINNAKWCSMDDLCTLITFLSDLEPGRYHLLEIGPSILTRSVH